MVTEKRLIDANALLESGYNVTMDEVFPDWHELPVSTQEAVCKHGQYLKKIINELPTVDAVEVVHGWWEPRKDVPGFVCCSVCHDCNIYDDWADGKKWNYCPNCGAKMDGDGRTMKIKTALITRGKTHEGNRNGENDR